MDVKKKQEEDLSKTPFGVISPLRDVLLMRLSAEEPLDRALQAAGSAPHGTARDGDPCFPGAQEWDLRAGPTEDRKKRPFR